jgi:hypothetical protein
VGRIDATCNGARVRQDVHQIRFVSWCISNEGGYSSIPGGEILCQDVHFAPTMP